jgi:hypothetical protein
VPHDTDHRYTLLPEMSVCWQPSMIGLADRCQGQPIQSEETVAQMLSIATLSDGLPLGAAKLVQRRHTPGRTMPEILAQALAEQLAKA